MADQDDALTAALIRRVRTREGAKKFGQPEGSIIKPDLKIKPIARIHFPDVGHSTPESSPFSLIWFVSKDGASVRKEKGFTDTGEAKKWAKENIHPETNGSVLPEVPESLVKTVEVENEGGQKYDETQFDGRTYESGVFKYGATNRYAVIVSNPPGTVVPAPIAPASAFTSGKQVAYGTVNPRLKAGDDGHETPQVSYADGTSPMTDAKVIDKNGRTGTVIKTYQAYTAVKWDDTGRSKTVKNDTLNSHATPSPEASAPAAPRKRSLINTGPKKPTVRLPMAAKPDHVREGEPEVRREALKNTNPATPDRHYTYDDESSAAVRRRAVELGFMINCQRVAGVYELRRRGFKVKANPNTFEQDQKFSSFTDNDIARQWIDPKTGVSRYWTRTNSKEDFESKALAQGIGARGYVCGQWKRGGGHIWNYEVVEDDSGNPKLVWADAQGQKNDQLFDSYSSKLDWEREVTTRGVKFIRLDDQEPNWKVMEEKNVFRDEDELYDHEIAEKDPSRVKITHETLDAVKVYEGHILTDNITGNEVTVIRVDLPDNNPGTVALQLQDSEGRKRWIYKSAFDPVDIIRKELIDKPPELEQKPFYAAGLSAKAQKLYAKYGDDPVIIAQKLSDTLAAWNNTYASRRLRELSAADAKGYAFKSYDMADWAKYSKDKEEIRKKTLVHQELLAALYQHKLGGGKTPEADATLMKYAQAQDNGPKSVTTGDFQKMRDRYVINDVRTTAMQAELRSDDPSPASTRWASGISRWIKASEAQRDLRLFRGAVLPPAVLDNFKAGSTFSSPGFTSTDASESTAHFYGESRLNDIWDGVPVLFTILAPKGSKVADASYGEYVFGRNQKFKIHEIETKQDAKGFIRMMIEAIND